MREAYLTQWSQVRPARAVANGYALARQLAPLFLAWRFVQATWPHLRSAELAELVPYFLRRALRAERTP
jgi:hypothetical protein